MSNREETTLDGTPWTLAVDDGAGELHIEHAESGNAYVFDAEGNLRVPGDGDVGDLHAVRDALASALAEPEGTAQRTSEEACLVACDEETGELKLRSDEAISLEAPTIDLESDQSLSLTASGQLSIDAALIQAMAAGQMTLQGALIELN